MLTEQAYGERKWGGLPRLREILQSKSVPERFRTLCSTDDTPHEAEHRFQDILAVLLDNSEEVVLAAHSQPIEFIRDLQRVSEGIDHFSDWHMHEAERLKEMRPVVVGLIDRLKSLSVLP